MVGEQIFRPQAALSALARRPEGAAAMALVGLRVAAVGGFVRDALIGREPRELDLVVEGDPAEVARQLGGEVVRHPQFLACHVSRDGWSIEVTGARTERYPRPGALPLVAPASIEADLVRRDFTVNAIAVTLEGELIAPPGALDDLAAPRPLPPSAGLRGRSVERIAGGRGGPRHRERSADRNRAAPDCARARPARATR